MRLFESLYLKHEWKTWIYAQLLSLLCYFCIRLLLIDNLSVDEGGLTQVLGNVFFILKPYILPICIAIACSIFSWKIYEEFVDKNQYNVCILSIFITFGIMISVDKFIFGIF